MSYWKLLTARWGYGEGETGQLVIDAATSALRIITDRHSAIHLGYHFEILDVFDLSNGEVRDFRVTQPDTTRWGHATFGIGCESQTEVLIYEGAAITTTGAPGRIVNNNRNSTIDPLVGIDFIDNSSVANADADTDISGAAIIGNYMVGTGKDGGVIKRESELVLKQNTIYNVRVIAVTGGYINYGFQWYELDNKYG